LSAKLAETEEQFTNILMVSGFVQTAAISESPANDAKRNE
jgi:hypothetical protein